MRGLEDIMDIKLEDIVYLLDGYLFNKYKVVMYSLYIWFLINFMNKIICFWFFFY